jgi:hypothetical protein
LSATNPHYWGAAYFQEDYSKEIGVFDDLNNKIEALFTNLGLAESFEFGSKEGLEVDDLIDYQYMFGMPYFKDVVELGEYSSFETINLFILLNCLNRKWPCMALGCLEMKENKFFYQ